MAILSAAFTDTAATVDSSSPCIHESHLSRPSGSIHFMPFTPQATDLSFNLLPSLLQYTSRSAQCILPRLPHLRCQFLPARVSFIPLPSAPPLTLPFLLLSFMFTLFHLLSFKISLPRSSLFRSKSLDMVYCRSMQFTANIFLMDEVHCNTTFKYYIKAVVQKPYKI